jgi:8-oxo-dGTP diphosphatase
MIDVVCAIILQEKRVLACQRPFEKEEGGKWEFAGGKVEAGELFEDALLREISEELGIQIEIGTALTPVEHGTIRLRPYLCKITSGVPTLHEHIACEWVEASAGNLLDWAPADVPVWKELKKENLVF